MDLSLLTWRKSRFSGNGDDSWCVEVGRLEAGAAVRDSKSPESGLLTFPAAPWGTFLNTLINR
ncbi:MAG: DUF397 domain-containing protein [Kibdelosporangium sp.]